MEAFTEPGEPDRSQRRRHMDVNRTIRRHPRYRSAGVGRWSCMLLLVHLLAACSGNPREEGFPAREEATVRVENRAWSEMTIYAMAGGQRVRLGSVAASSTAVLRIPPGVVGMGRSLTFVADPLGSDRTSSSFEIYVRPGEEITLVIPTQAG